MVNPSSTGGFLDQRIAGAAAAALVTDEDAFLDENLDIAQRCIVRRLGELGPFRGVQFSLEAIEQPVDHYTLTLIE